MKGFNTAITLTLAVLLILFLVTVSQAAFTTTGNVEPSAPYTWTSSTMGYIGNTADGTLRVDLGSELLSYSGHLGYNSGTTGEVTVDDMGSTWTTFHYLYVGVSGNGMLNIIDGGAVSSHHGFIADNSGSTSAVTVDGVGSTWTNSYYLHVGRVGNATLNITGGGAVKNRYSHIGGRLGSMGAVTVDGAGSTWNNQYNLYVGHFGDGTLSISNNGLVSVGEILTIDYDNDGNGFVDMCGGGMLALTGDADDSIDSFMELIEGSDALRYWNESTLLWENITTATAGSDYTLAYQDAGDLAGYTLLTVLTDIPLLGDSNLDDCVDVIDLGTLATNYGATSGANWAMGDFNFDGAVDVGDLGILASNYRKGLSSVASVPEPGSIALLICGIVSLACRRRRE